MTPQTMPPNLPLLEALARLVGEYPSVGQSIIRECFAAGAQAVYNLKKEPMPEALKKLILTP